MGMAGLLLLDPPKAFGVGVLRGPTARHVAVGRIARLTQARRRIDGMTRVLGRALDRLLAKPDGSGSGALQIRPGVVIDCGVTR